MMIRIRGKENGQTRKMREKKRKQKTIAKGSGNRGEWKESQE